MQQALPHKFETILLHQWSSHLTHHWITNWRMMLDIIVLFTLFLVLVGTLGLVQYLQRMPESCDPALGKKLLQEWLQAHMLTLPDVKNVLFVLNQQLKELELEVSTARGENVCVCVWHFDSSRNCLF